MAEVKALSGSELGEASTEKSLTVPNTWDGGKPDALPIVGILSVKLVPSLLSSVIF